MRKLKTVLCLMLLCLPMLLVADGIFEKELKFSVDMLFVKENRMIPALMRIGRMRIKKNTAEERAELVFSVITQERYWIFFHEKIHTNMKMKQLLQKTEKELENFNPDTQKEVLIGSTQSGRAEIKFSLVSSAKGNAKTTLVIVEFKSGNSYNDLHSKLPLPKKAFQVFKKMLLELCFNK